MRRTSLGLLLLSLLLLAGCAAGDTRRRIQLPTRSDTAAFSNAVLVGDELHLAGHVGRDPQTGQIPDDPRRETELIFEQLEALLAKADMTTDDLVSVTVYCTDVTLYAAFNDVYRSRFSGGFPSRAFVGIKELIGGARFEVSGLAVRR